MSPLLRFFLIAAGGWGGCVALSLSLIGVTAAITQTWPAGRMQLVIFILLGIMTLLFIAGLLIFLSTGKGVLSQGFHRLFKVIYACGMLLTLLILGFVALVVLNR